MSDRKERLMAVRAKTENDHPQAQPLRNPDGPDALARIEELERLARHLIVWIEDDVGAELPFGVGLPCR